MKLTFHRIKWISGIPGTWPEFSFKIPDRVHREFLPFAEMLQMKTLSVYLFRRTCAARAGGCGMISVSLPFTLRAQKISTDDD
jgi:hypothetical protein